MRRWVCLARRVHRAIALVVGLHFVLIATTGALFIFEPELNHWARDLRGWSATAGDVGPDQCYAAVADAYPEWDGLFLFFPDPDKPFYTAYLGGESANFWTDVFVDPGSGRIVGTINNASWSIEGCLQVAIQLHIRLCAGEVGRQLVDASVVLFVIELVTGVLLWWPGLRRIGRAFAFRMRRTRFIAFYDTHRLAGVLAFPFLVTMALTGLLWGYPRVVVPLVYWCCGEAAPAESEAYRDTEESTTPELLGVDESPLPFSRVIRTAGTELSPAGIAYLNLEHLRSRTVTLGIHAGKDVADGGAIESVVVDRRTAGLVNQTLRPGTRRSLADRLTNELAHELHYGTFGGLPTRLLYLAACLAVDLLYVTGVTMWIIKRRRRGRVLEVAAKRRADPLAS